MDFEITGEETQEQLEELMAKMGEIEVEGDDEEQEESAEHPDSESSETVQTDTCDKQAPTPGAGTEEEGQPQEDVKGILARDGKHVIPYDVLEAERTGRQRVEQEAFLLKQQLAEEQRKIDLLTSQIKQAGMTPDPLPEDTRISDEQIARIKEEYPEVANALTLMARKYDYLQARIQEAQQVPQENPVVQAMNAVPDLVVWQRSDPDKFAVAIHLDEKLQTDPAWKDKPLTERFAEVARRTRAAYGEVPPEPVAEQDKNQKVLAAVADKVAKADAAAALPDSPSDVGNTAAVPQDKFEQLLGASYADAEAVMSGMSDADIDAILEKLG
ncbi:hypothetical protein WJD08_02180 [Salmonella enterica subsp. enterica serovar Corvallis]|uniref:hypothetical protein n=1 Tax=Salmonella enterica TaxID=28901 RepID=UPI00107D2B2A|nr:hypothetical protein [Salmonella enterica]EAA3107253.1 hypothetical protein [Salmonella enterica subsp. enterica serovar Duisburg]EBR8739122.1 hypothetical protein [Salmonella enterica subsp. enterica serovar Godesberg]EBS4503181.1 hypothetical protein [Salmonella enterica subsp. enterica serovar Molade]EBV6971429.1 hypothetical protein [Salmonella enterica subsp. enterica serovar Gaminara]ECC3923568.1 hypothetical protein [Salmonella enterica subsp. enterica]ECO0313763.1 hypothetical prot